MDWQHDYITFYYDRIAISQFPTPSTQVPKFLRKEYKNTRRKRNKKREKKRG
jgi:hypothetical protein